MDIEVAISIPLIRILDILGYKPIKQTEHEIHYASPFCKLQYACLKVYPAKNTWIDECLNKNGNTLTFACLYLEKQGQPHSLADGLQFIAGILGYSINIQPINCIDDIQEETSFRIEQVTSINHRALINYLRQKGIHHKVAQRYLKQIRLYNAETSEYFIALGLKNEEEGWEIFNPYYRKYIGKRDPNLIKGLNPNPEGVHVFKDIFDFLSAIMQEPARRFRDGALVLHSYTLLPQATPHLKGCGHRQVITWFADDESGRLATRSLSDFFKTQQGLLHKKRLPIVLSSPDDTKDPLESCCG